MKQIIVIFLLIMQIDGLHADGRIFDGSIGVSLRGSFSEYNSFEITGPYGGVLADFGFFIVHDIPIGIEIGWFANWLTFFFRMDFTVIPVRIYTRFPLYPFIIQPYIGASIDNIDHPHFSDRGNGWVFELHEFETGMRVGFVLGGVLEYGIDYAFTLRFYEFALNIRNKIGNYAGLHFQF